MFILLKCLYYLMLVLIIIVSAVFLLFFIPFVFAFIMLVLLLAFILLTIIFNFIFNCIDQIILVFISTTSIIHLQYSKSLLSLILNSIKYSLHFVLSVHFYFLQSIVLLLLFDYFLHFMHFLKYALILEFIVLLY